MNIYDIKRCHVCHGDNLIETHLVIEDLFGNVFERPVKICKDCDTIHYVHNNSVFYEFSLKVNKYYKPKEKIIYTDE